MDSPSTSDDARKAEQREAARFASMGGSHRKYAGLGLQAGLAVVFYTGAGLLVDRWLGTLPWFTVAGAFLGIFSMFYLFFRISKVMDDEPRPPKKENGTSGKA